MIDLKKTKAQICVAIGTLATIFFSIWGILQVDDRWNQAYGVEENCSKIDVVKNEVIEVAGELTKEMSLRFEEQRLVNLQDKLIKLKIDRSKNPEDQDIRDWIEDTRKAIQRTQENIERLKKKDG